MINALQPQDLMVLEFEPDKAEERNRKSDCSKNKTPQRANS